MTAERCGRVCLLSCVMMKMNGRVGELCNTDLREAGGGGQGRGRGWGEIRGREMRGSDRRENEGELEGTDESSELE